MHVQKICSDLPRDLGTAGNFQYISIICTSRLPIVFVKAPSNFNNKITTCSGVAHHIHEFVPHSWKHHKMVENLIKSSCFSSSLYIGAQRYWVLATGNAAYNPVWNFGPYWLKISLSGRNFKLKFWFFLHNVVFNFSQWDFCPVKA